MRTIPHSIRRRRDAQYGAARLGRPSEPGDSVFTRMAAIGLLQSQWKGACRRPFAARFADWGLRAINELRLNSRCSRSRFGVWDVTKGYFDLRYYAT